MAECVGPAERTIYLIYFLSHIPITLFIDSQAILPGRWFPALPVDLLGWHIETNHDFLMRTRPDWFRSLVFVEVLLQLPFFVVASRALLARTEARFRAAFVVYGAHTATTMVPILGEIILRGGDAFPTESHRWRLVAIYVPYLAVPLAIARSFAARWPEAPGAKGD